MNLLYSKFLKVDRINLQLVAFLVLIVLFLILGISGFYGFPISLGDKEGFYPVIHNLSSNNEFSHPFMCFTCEERMGNPFKTKFMNHGFLFPWIQSSLLFFSEYEKIETASSLLFLINGFVLIYIINLKVKKNFIIFIIGISIYLYQIGRPELIISLILAVDWYITKQKYFNYQIILTSSISALLFSVSPVALILYFPYIFLKNNYFKLDNKYYLSISYYLLTPILIVLIFHLFVNQFTFFEWIQGLIKASGHYHPVNILPGKNYEDFGHSSLHEIFIYFIKGPRFLPFLFICIFVCFFGLIKDCIQTNKLIILFTLIFISLLFWFGIRRTIFIYNILAFIPFILLMLKEDESRFSKINKILLSVFSLACVASLLFYSIYKPIYTLIDGNNVKDLKYSLATIEDTQTVQVPKEFWMHSSKKKNIGFITTSPFNKESKSSFYADILYFSELSLGKIKNRDVPKINGYCVDDVKLRLSNITLYDYSYIRYRRCN